MSTHERHGRHHRELESHQFQLIGAALLIALGAVFLAQQAGVLEHSANWWVIFLLIPGIGLLWNAFTGHQDAQASRTSQTTEIILGVLLIALTVIFIFDPTWSFLGDTFRSSAWDRIWRWAVLVVGVLMFVGGILGNARGISVLGAILAVVGGVFVFDINWDYVWPLALIIPGLWLLYNALRRPSAT